MRRGDARDGPDRIAPRLERAGDRLDVAAVHIDVDRVVVGLDARAERGRRGGRVGVGMGHVAILADQVRQARPPRPRRRPAAGRVVAARQFAAGVLHRLGIDIALRLVVRRTRHAEAEVGQRAPVILEREARAPALRVFHRAAGRDRGSPGGVPVHAVEDHEHDVLLTGIGRRELQAVDVGLVEVFGVGVERAVGLPAVERGELRGIAVDTVRAADGGQRHAERVDRDQPVRVARMGDVLLRLVTPVAPPGAAGEFGVGLHPPDPVRRRDVEILRGGGGIPAAADREDEGNEARDRRMRGVAHGRSIPAATGPAIARETRRDARFLGSSLPGRQVHAMASPRCFG